MQITSIKTPIEFSHEIEEIILKHKIEYFDAIMLYSETNNVDIEVVASLVKHIAMM
jgi:hypothetical protein